MRSLSAHRVKPAPEREKTARSVTETHLEISVRRAALSAKTRLNQPRAWARVDSGEVRGVRQQGNLARAQDRGAQTTLILCAQSGDASRQHLSRRGEEKFKQFRILIIDAPGRILVEGVDLATAAPVDAPVFAASHNISLVMHYEGSINPMRERPALRRSHKPDLSQII